MIAYRATLCRFGAVLAAASMMTASPAMAAVPAAQTSAASKPAAAATFNMAGAEDLRRLDIMLMVTGLRCRKTADDFQADYGRFTTKHYPELQAAALSLKSDLAKRYGAAGANRALDKMSVQMANEYGQGHPWLSCGDLKQVTRGLATSVGSASLTAASRTLLKPTGSARLALAG
jgi:hypothetical protein